MTTTATTKEYAVFGPGWGSQQLTGLGTGNIAYRGKSLSQAKRFLAREKASVRRMQKQPHMRSASDTYYVAVRENGPNWSVL